MDKLSRPIWIGKRWSCMMQKFIPAHLIECIEELQAEKESLKEELDYLHPKRKDGQWDRRYSRNKEGPWGALASAKERYGPIELWRELWKDLESYSHE